MANDILLLPTNDTFKPVDKSVKKLHAHPSIRKIKDNLRFSNNFDFVKVTIAEVARKMKQLNARKSYPAEFIPSVSKTKMEMQYVAFQNIQNSSYAWCFQRDTR